MKRKLLLHTCCGPCFLGTYENLKASDFEITNYFHNPNIWPEEEYQRRKENLKKVTAEIGSEFIEGEYLPGEHAVAIRGLESEFPGRCLECYRIRLEKTAQYAKENGYDFFSTTLLVSPYQQHEALKEIGEKIGKQIGVPFCYQDFRPGYRAGQTKAKELEIYRQKYCGCKYSKEYK